MDYLEEVIEISHSFGTEDYVNGGGGNISVKDSKTLWIKPSGTSLATLKRPDLVALDRSRLDTLYSIDLSKDSAACEASVQNIMLSAVQNGNKNRPSVESPLHNLLDAKYVVHTHPAIVNSMTCSKNGVNTSKLLFPDALWCDYINPGYELCMEVRKSIDRYKDKYGLEPEIIFLTNHGVFVVADTKERLHFVYDFIFDCLKQKYTEAGVPLTLPVGEKPAKELNEQLKQQIQSFYSSWNSMFISSDGFFKLAEGPISPDHIVYAGSFPYIGTPTEDGLTRYKNRYNVLPLIFAQQDAVFAIGPTQNKADLALGITRNGALIKQLADAFGGIEYMSEKASSFIQNWEAEIYRCKQIE